MCTRTSTEEQKLEDWFTYVPRLCTHYHIVTNALERLQHFSSYQNLYNSSANKRKEYKPNVKITTKKRLDPHAEHQLKQKMKAEKVKLNFQHGAAAPKLPVKKPHYPKFM